MKVDKLLDLPINKNVKFNIFPNCNEYSEGYYEAFFEGETINGSVIVEYPKPEMVKCVRVQLVGFISKNNILNFQDILKYINFYENPNINNNSTAHSNNNSNNNLNGSNNNNNNNNNNDNSDTSISKYEGLKILVDQDHIIWGDLGTQFIDCSKSFKDFYKINGTVSSMDEVYSTRLDFINSKFSSSFMSGKKILPFYFHLKHKSNNTSIPLPSSYKIGNYKIEYFMCATIYKDWQDKKIMLIKKLRVYQQIDIDPYMNMNPLKVEKQWNISNSNDKDLIEMKISIPNNSFCHRKIIPITVDINNLSVNKTIAGFIVGLYEYCSIKNNLKKINKYSLTLLSERFYELKIKPQSKNIRYQLLFPLIDGNCYIKKRIISEEDENPGEKNPSDNLLQLIEVKIPSISATINERSRWPIIVQHKLRIVALTEEDMRDYKKRKNKHSKTLVINTDNDVNMKGANNNGIESEDQNDSNNSLIQIMNKLKFFDQYYDGSNEENYNSNSSSLSNTNEISSSSSRNYKNNYNYTNSNDDNSNSIMEDDHYEEDEGIPNSLLIENRKYGEILGHLSNKYGYFISPTMKELDFEFDIIIGTITKTQRECGEELCLNKEFDDQFYNVILNTSKYRQKLFQNENSDKNRKSPNYDRRNRNGNGLRENQKEDSLTSIPTPKSLLYVSNNSNELLLPEDMLNKKNEKKNITYHPHSSKVSPIYEATLSSSIISASQNQIKSDLLHDDQIPSFDDYSIYSNSYNYQNNIIVVPNDSVYNNKDDSNNNNNNNNNDNNNNASRKQSTSSSRKSSMKDKLLPKSNNNKINKTDKSLKSHPVTSKVSPIYEATLSSSLCQSPNQIQNKANDF